MRSVALLHTSAHCGLSNLYNSVFPIALSKYTFIPATNSSNTSASALPNLLFPFSSSKYESMMKLTGALLGKGTTSVGAR